jgi:Icc protein
MGSIMLISREKYFRFFIILLTVIVFLTSSDIYAEENQVNNFNFVQITDTHFGHLDHQHRTEKAVEMINSLPVPIKFVVHTGDITMDRTEDKEVVDSALSVMNKISVPVYYVPGNHDILIKKLDSTGKIYKEKFGELISKAEINGVLFLFVYTEPLARKFTVNGYEPFEELEKELKESGGKPVIIFHHSPSVDDFYNNKFHEGWERETREQWVKLLNDYNVKAVIAGHFHRDEHHWLGNVPLYISASIAGYWGRQASFRIYEYRNGKISYRTQYIE